MKVLLCTPYLQTPDIVLGGIGIWADNILNYYHSIETDIELIPVSFDRKSYIDAHVSLVKRVWSGINELGVAVENAKKMMKKQQPDVVHICTSASLSLIKDLILLKVAKKYNVKSVIHFHFGRIPELSIRKNWEWKLIKKVLVAADIVITIDQKSYDKILNLGYGNVHYCPNPLFLSSLNQIDNESGQIQRLKNKILFVGHVIKTKGVYELVEACKQIDDIELHVVGKVLQDVKNDLQNIASIKDNGKWLRFTGEISHDEVLREMMSASIFAFPSYTEGFPNAILEAMACGCPIVTTNVGAIPEMLDVANGNNYGICVEPQNMQAFADGLKTMIENPSYADSCGKNAKKRVNEMYAIPVVWKQLENIWKGGVK